MLGATRGLQSRCSASSIWFCKNAGSKVSSTDPTCSFALRAARAHESDERNTTSCTADLLAKPSGGGLYGFSKETNEPSTDFINFRSQLTTCATRETVLSSQLGPQPFLEANIVRCPRAPVIGCFEVNVGSRTKRQHQRHINRSIQFTTAIRTISLHFDVLILLLV